MQISEITPHSNNYPQGRASTDPTSSEKLFSAIDRQKYPA